MNAVMPGHSPPQFQPYGGGLAPEEGVDNLPANSQYGSVNANSNANDATHATNDGNSNGISNINLNPGPDDPAERSGANISNNSNNNSNNYGTEMTKGPNHQRHPPVPTSASPMEYVHVQVPQGNPPQSMVSPMRQKLQTQSQSQSHRSLSSDPLPHQMSPHSMMGAPMGPPSPPTGFGPDINRPPFGLGVPQGPVGNPHPLFHNPETASHPWSIGSTDGSYTLIHLQQQMQIQQQKQQHEELQRREAAAAAGAAAAAESNTTTANDEEGGPADDAPPDSSGVPAGPDGIGVPAGAAAPGGTGETTDPAITASTAAGAPTASTLPPGGPAAAAAAQTVPSAVSVVQASIQQLAAVVRSGRSLYHDKLFHQSSSSVEGVLAASCDVMGFDIAEMWLRTGPKTHQLTNSHLRPTALQDSVRQDLVEVYYGERSNERTHRLSPALCKRAKDANDVVWVTAHNQTGVEALRMSISNVRTAVAVPVCHEASNTNVTIIYFSIRRIVLRPAAVEFLVHMSLSAAVTSVNALSLDGLLDRVDVPESNNTGVPSHSAHADVHRNSALSKTTDGRRSKSDVHAHRPPSAIIRHQRADKTSITGARLDLQWRQLLNVEYLTDGGNSWIHTAVFDGKPVVVKTLRPECQDTAVAINEIESEVGE